MNLRLTHWLARLACLALCVAATAQQDLAEREFAERKELHAAAPAVGTRVHAQLAPDHGRVGARVTLSGTGYQLRQIGKGVPSPTDTQLRLWSMSLDVLASPPVATLQMPFDVPTALLAVGNNNFLLCGLNRATSASFLCRVALQTGPQLVLLETVALDPGVTYSQLMSNSVDGMLYGLRYAEPIVDAGAWSLAGPLPSMSATTSLGGAIAAAGVVTVGEMFPARFQGLPSGGVVLASSFPDSPAETRLWLRQQGTGWTVTTFSPTNALATINTCATDYPMFQDNDGPVFFRGRSGFVQLMDTSSGAIVGTTSVSQDWQPTPYTLLQPLTVGRAYRPLGVNCTGTDFWPTFRAGFHTEAAGHQIGLGEFSQREFVVGNTDFAVWSRVRHAPDVCDMLGPSQSFLWVKLGEPTSANLWVMPGGEVILANPDATYGPGPYDAPMVEGQNLVHFPLSLAGTEPFVGQPVIFQFVYFLPSGQVIISDVFGGKLMAATPNGASRPTANSSQELWRSQEDWIHHGACPPWQAALLRSHAVRTILRQ